MGLFGNLMSAVGGMAGIKTMQLGSDRLLLNHTILDPFAVPGPLKDMANEAIRRSFLTEIPTITEFEAALLKLAVYCKAAEAIESSEHLELFQTAVTQIREVAEPGSIRPAISLQVTADTGH